MSPSNPSPPPPAAKDRTMATLRSSCDTCAASKIRCTKEKPECVRCAKRGLACSYSIPRRPGRPSQNRQQQQQREQQQQAASRAGTAVSTAANSPSSGRPSTATTADGHGLDGMPSLNHIDTLTPPPSHGSPAPGHMSPSFSAGHISPAMCSQMVTALLSPENEPWSLPPMSGHSELDPLFDMGGFDAGYDAMDMGADLFGDMGGDLFGDLGGVEHHDPLGVGFPPLAFDQCIPTPAQSSPSLSAHKPRTSLTSNPEYPGVAATDSSAPSSAASSTADSRPLNLPRSCPCQQRALELMGQPSPSQARQGKGDTPSFESVLDLNHAATEAMGDILQCACRKDAYLLVVLALAMYKVLEWYDAAAAAAGQSSNLIAPPSAGIDGDRASVDDPGRTAALIVLSRMPSVQRIVNYLAEQLKLLFQTEQRPGELDSIEKNANHWVAASLLSTPLTGSLEENLRKRTRDLAQRVMAQLR